MREQPFPLGDVLRDSLYYPASGLQGAPVQYLTGHILSFVYVDYGYRRDEFRRELKDPGFIGYDSVGIRAVEQELAPQEWVVKDLLSCDGNPQRHQNWIKPPFCDWVVLERCAEYTGSHGPERFSFLHICADGVAAFQELYVRNKITPKAIAIIQPGTGFGYNWTDFEDHTKILGRNVLGNPTGSPEFLLNGGRGRRGSSNNCPWWPVYQEPVIVNDDGSNFLGDTGISVWAKT